MGTTALLYNRPEMNIGKDAFVDGLSVTGSIGDVDVAAVAARENNIWLPNNSLYALRMGYNLSKRTNLRFTLAQYQKFNANTTHHWAIDRTVTFGKSSLTAEYTQSDISNANKAYAISWNYKFNEKTSACVTNFRVEANGDMGGQSEFDNNNRGFHYGITHAFSGKLSLEWSTRIKFPCAQHQKHILIIAGHLHIWPVVLTHLNCYKFYKEKVFSFVVIILSLIWYKNFVSSL